MALTEVEIKRAQPADRIYKLTYGRGLFAQVRPIGVKMFVKEYRFAGKRRSDSLGIYPALKLAEARSESGTDQDTGEGWIRPSSGEDTGP